MYEEQPITGQERAENILGNRHENDNDAYKYKEEGEKLLEFEQYNDAIMALDRAIDIDKKYATAYSLKAWALFKLNKYEEALEANTQAMHLDAKGLFANHLTLQGWLFYHLGRYEEALTMLEQALQQGAEYDVLAYEAVGRTFFQLQRYQEALSAFEQALLLDPHDEELLAAKQQVLAKMQQ